MRPAAPNYGLSATTARWATSFRCRTSSSCSREKAHKTSWRPIVVAVFFQSSGSSQALAHAYQMAHKAIALNDSEPEAYMLLGSLDLTKRRYDQAISEG